MYLIEIETLRLKEFIEGRIPPYAILSHRWGPEELAFKDVLKNRADKSSRGYRKLLGACQAAKSYKVKYLWIDTCCIDKKSSAELSEAINSMFSWYKNAEVCLAYLEDVDHFNVDFEQAFKNTVWFTRAWTLQELLSPSKLDFYDCKWHAIGNRESQAKLIQSVTGIPLDCLTRKMSPEHYSIAERMSWAAEREAARNEDIAYSLMGLFDVNMPLLYGEGNKAFVRLQEEIIRNSKGDPSILSWGFGPAKYRLLAHRPTDFRNPQVHAELKGEYRPIRLYTPLDLTGVGLTTKLYLYRWQELNTYAAVIGVYRPRKRQFFRFLLLQQYAQWTRVWAIGTVEAEAINFTENECRWKTLTIQRHMLDPVREGTRNGFIIAVTREPMSILANVEASTNWAGPQASVKWKNLHSSFYTGMLCTFDTATVPGVARFNVSIDDVDLWVNAYFDFDSRPCVCTSFHPIEVQPLPDSTPEDQDDLIRHIKSKSHAPRQLRDDLGRTYCLSSAQLDSCYHYQLSIQPPIWLKLVSPDQSSTRYWSLLFSPDELE